MTKKKRFMALTPDMIRDFVEHGTHDPEEYPFSEEIQVRRQPFSAGRTLDS